MRDKASLTEKTENVQKEHCPFVIGSIVSKPELAAINPSQNPQYGNVQEEHKCCAVTDLMKEDSKIM